MNSRRPPARLDLETYFVADAASQERLEFLDGAIFAMTGGSISHARICRNVTVGLSNRLKGKRCEPFAGDLRVFIPDANVATYPDAGVYCGPVQFHAGRTDTSLNPTLLLEVLSPSTRTYDRGEKFVFYQGIPSLQQYVLVHQDRAVMEVFTRQPDNTWVPSLWQGRDAVVDLASIGVQLPLAEVFDGVDTDANAAG